MNALVLFCLTLLSTDVGNPNPLLVEVNQLIGYDQLQPQHIKTATDAALARLDKDIEAIYSIEKRTFTNTARAYDHATDRLFRVYGPINLLANTTSDDTLREACHEASQRLSERLNALAMDTKMFEAFKAYAAGAEAAALKGDRARFLKLTMDEYHRSGLNLPAEQREELRKLNDRLSQLDQDFSRNIAEYEDALILTEAQLEGLDDAYKQQHRQEDGTYKVDLSYPSYRPFMQYAVDENARRRLFVKYNNRARDKNLPVLQEVLRLRKKVAHILGYASYAEYALAGKLAGTPKTVLDFEHGLIEALMPKHKTEYATLIAAKKADTKQEVSVVNAWESSFYGQKVLLENYQVDQRKVKEYFEIGNVLKGLFLVTQKLMGVTFQKVEDATVWHPDVSLYRVVEADKTLGYFYLDLYPRPNKYTHAACFPIIIGSRETGQLPVAALVCNFPEPSDGAPALMSHGQVQTFFHEFGHVLHNILSEARLYSQFGTSVAMDFVEAPSQIFENWTWDYDTLSLFAFHHQTGELLPKALFEKMSKARNAFSATQHLRQVFYGLLDLSYHHLYDPDGKQTTNELRLELERKTSLFPVLEETHLQAAFGHLMGYGANYYGYLYSKVFSQDMFSKFEESGPLNEAMGMRYRKTVLAGGDTQHPMKLMEAFLGRPPNNRAFARSLGID